MEFSVSSRSRYQYESVTLGTDEEFVRLYKSATEGGDLNFQILRDLERICLPVSLPVETVADEQRQMFQDCVRDVDQLMKRTEKNASFSEVLAGIMLQFEQKVFPTLRDCQFYSRSTAECLLIFFKELLKDLLKFFAECVSSGLESAHKVVVSALALLSFVYQYIIGCVDKGGSKTYSPGSFLFRLIFVAIVLFLGSYVWIKSRQASHTANRRKRKLEDQSDVPEGVYRRAVKDSRGSVIHYRYEPRFKPRRENPESGTPLKFNCLSLGSYDTPREAEIVRHLAAVLYGKEEVRPVQFEGGICLPFPSVTEPEKCPPSGKEKAVWVTRKTKQLYAELLEEKKRREKIYHPGLETGSYDGHDGEASRSDPSPSAPGAPNTASELTCFNPPHGDNGLVDQPTISEYHGLGQEPTLAREEFLASVSDFDFEQFISSTLLREENDFSAMDKIEGDYFETDCVLGIESTLVPPQSSALDIPTSAFFASLPQLSVRDQGLEIIESHLNSAKAIPFQQLKSLPEQVPVRQRVTSQEKRPEEFAASHVELQRKLLESEVRNSELQQKLLESEVRNSELQQKLRKAEVANEKWRSMFHQVAKLMSASNLDVYPVEPQ